MRSINSIAELHIQLESWRKQGERIALVPTMGNLHAGHLSLVKSAQAQVDRVVVSIFVNPTQFGPGEDFESYPRTLSEDQAKLSQNGVDLLFIPEASEIYAQEAATQVVVGGLSKKLCGAFRPGHFTGVATVVAKLFNIVRPEVAYFGEKDFQQLTIIRKMVKDLHFPIRIESVATVREADGLAMSSRNAYLDRDQRALAPLLYQSLCAAQQQLQNGEKQYPEIEMLYLNRLREAGFVPDYFSICCADNLSPAALNDKRLVILVAAKLGKTRLIDNISVSL